MLQPGVDRAGVHRQHRPPVHNERPDVIGTNVLGQALLPPPIPGTDRVNLARSVFLDPVARTFWPDWDPVADDIISRGRAAIRRPGGDPADVHD
ncbi:hypothetical protein Kisp02_21760 [Kineosporia sp. NBRC 101731]|nr:hypothetical protein Kisp02_21760 [Kineosporia sp. NBRC 101731]